MQVLDPYTVPLQSINLIEASAGTGKSWTVTLLYLRLILESNLTVDQILVVTFTDAATKELRDAIRHRLVEALAVFENPDADIYSDKPEYQQLFNKITAKDDNAQAIAISRLQRAKFSIDEAAIFTIHSFCQRALSENAFEASLPFESELMDNDKVLMQKLTDDYWRRNFYKAPKALLYKLQQKSITPDSLLEEIWPHVGKPYLQIKGPAKTTVSDAQWEKLSQLFTQALALWDSDRDEITKLVLGNKNLNGNKYRKNTVEKNCSQFSCITSLVDINKKLLETDLKRFKASALKEGTKDNAETPTHPFFEHWEAFSDLWEEIELSAEGTISQIRIDLLKHLQEALPKEKKRLGVLSYDDLLLQLQSALHKENSTLAKHLREKYKAALIDEFQDTDPIQFDIFSTIYSDMADDNAVFLVGDPKQAIYSFRGGDIYTYLNAKQNIAEDNQFTLNTNYRSHQDLISAFNTLYEHSDNPFQDTGIQYEKISAGKKLASLENKDGQKPLQFWQVIPEKEDKIDVVRNKIASAVAGDIATSLNNKLLIEGREAAGGDFAILVRSHTQGDLIKKALSERGIASIQSSKKTIFETHEADELLYLLTAIVEPQKEANVRRALVTEMMGKTAKDLLAFERDANLWEEQLARIQQWHFQWKKQGFLPMMRGVMRVSKMHQHLLAYADGERRLTNILHLSELIHRVTRQQSLSMEEVLRWLKNQQRELTFVDGKEGELRLESDENLVKIVTIHKAKGLEYPIVYCPFVALKGKAFTDKSYSFHQGEDSYLEMGSPQADEHKRLKLEEESAEQTRLLYVALTRAKYQCHVVCFPDGLSRNGDTALSWLITNGILVKDKKAYPEAYQKNLITLTNQCSHIGLEDLPVFDASVRYQCKAQTQQLRAREFTAEIRPQAQVTSFSGLTAGLHTQNHESVESIENIESNESPDYDQQAVVSSEKVTSNEDEFPKGATAGSALHEIFEHIDFTQPIYDQQDIVENSLSKWGFDQKHLSAANTLVDNTLKAEIFEGFSLDSLDKSDRLDEMEFYLPLNRLDVGKLKQVLLQFLPEGEAWNSTRDAIKTLNFRQIEGFLKGYIDLIFKYNNQYYIVDYKSNALTNYSPENIMPVMASSHYYLQYLLYSVALHRYLKKRLSDYSWEADIGGAYYLFIRGLHKNDKKGGGVLFNKPSMALITALDSLFMESLL